MHREYDSVRLWVVVKLLRLSRTDLPRLTRDLCVVGSTYWVPDSGNQKRSLVQVEELATAISFAENL